MFAANSCSAVVPTGRSVSTHTHIYHWYPQMNELHVKVQKHNYHCNPLPMFRRPSYGVYISPFGGTAVVTPYNFYYPGVRQYDTFVYPPRYR